LSKEYDVYILSAYLPDSNYALAEKKTWLRHWLPEIPEKNWILIPCGVSKGDYVKSSHDILIDDRWIHGKEWLDAGGRFIKVSRDLKDAKEEIKKHPFVLSPDMPSEEIVFNIKKLADKS
jgi:hypothetical protein